MASGKVKWFDNKKGFGFIAQSSGQDVFVHHSSIVGTGFKTLNEGDEVLFDLVLNDKALKSGKIAQALGGESKNIEENVDHISESTMRMIKKLEGI